MLLHRYHHKRYIVLSKPCYSILALSILSINHLRQCMTKHDCSTINRFVAAAPKLSDDMCNMTVTVLSYHLKHVTVLLHYRGYFYIIGGRGTALEKSNLLCSYILLVCLYIFIFYLLLCLYIFYCLAKM